ncbi:chromosomal replication initiator DnaA [Rhodovulum sp. BSW8]|uniref:Chromosomal replication initiator DnaA n=1 Tax=Rhodovulum visakhapatnamense TaxID=364297 RepID=A0A4R8G8V9_9RHOB|nr:MULTISPECIES: DnaA/Hda family protein [Rhodovulum]MBL3578445.1 chromosomal replication initiator DnaA [Rhodovulum visakhapatnamense]OLS45261.1 chromosomal replication initiator DnaA [Rhodovulum sulfidophilum]RBO54792.1 chromosomal replication initiator DnaA [Rhodovulum sp. BSW8]TDX33589.1 DnaA protein [Rhodovulum visakhapatnamense]
MVRQLALELPVRPARGRAAFFVAPPNALAVQQIDAWRDWPARKLVLIGPEASGKTHLVHVWADLASAEVIHARDLPQAELPALAAAGAVAVEDADRIAGRRQAEDALFHLHNLLAAEGGTLLMTARRAPRDWGLCLPDLASRVQAAATAHLEPPDDTLLAAVLVKLFADRQIAVSPDLIGYLVDRMERSFAAAAETVAAIDREALASRRKPGPRLAREVLDNGPGGDD